MKTIITIEDLEKIIKSAKEELRHDKTILPCVELESGAKSKNYGESDAIRVTILSTYSEATPKVICYINF